MSTLLPSMPTIGKIQRRTGATPHQIDYIIKSRRIRPVGRAGNARVFSESDVRRIADELRRIASARGQEARQ